MGSDFLSKEYFRTKIGLVAKLYCSHKNSAKIRGFSPATYTKEELKEWLFHNLYFILCMIIGKGWIIKRCMFQA